VATKEIKAYLAPGNDLGLRSETSQFFKIPEIRFIGVVGMIPYGGVNVLIFLGDFNRFSRTGEVSSNGYNARHPSFNRSLDNLVAVGVKIIHVEVGVAVDQHITISILLVSLSY
jgi:hypothetical protein